jgi:aspartyl-tRNA(Asn)/glutamyl-tRNA(Gln) amidotransferase subunit A
LTASGPNVTLWPDTDILTASRLLRDRKISAYDLLEAHLDRIALLDKKINACVTVTSERARESAHRADKRLGRRNETHSPLLGIPLALKDNFDLAGVRTTAGTKVLDANIAGTDSEVAGRLQSAGAVIVAKCNLDEIALGGGGGNPLVGRTINPWDGRGVAGGSSGGSGAAVAAGMCMGATGSDTGGSIRNPSAWCGVVGYKPTFDAVSTRGITPLSWSLDTAGFFGHSVTDVLLMFSETANELQAASQEVRNAWVSQILNGTRSPLRFQVAQDFFMRSEEGVRHHYLESVAKLAAVGTLADGAIPGVEGWLALLMVIMLVEAASAWSPFIAQADQFGIDVRMLLEVGRRIPATDYVDAQRARQVLREQMDDLFQHCDFVLMPSMGLTPTAEVIVDPNMGPSNRLWKMAAEYTCGWNLTGNPVLSIPCGFTDEGRPIALQIVGRRGEDAALLQAGLIAEEAWAIPRASLAPTWASEQAHLA